MKREFASLTRRLGVSRREFLTFCVGMAATMGLSTKDAMAIAKAVEGAKKRPVVIWLHGQECTGPTEALLKAEHPTLARLILEMISLDYHQTLAAGAGHAVEAVKDASIEANKGQYILVVEGSIPVKDGGIYCKIGGKTMLEHTRNAANNAAAIIAFGSCASWGGVPSSGPNPTEARGVAEIITDRPVVNIPGCPPNPYNFLATVLHFLTFGKLPALDKKGRPVFAYGRLIHENCERRPHFDAGRFATRFGDDGHRKGWCLYKLGCKGPETYANCPVIEFNDIGGGTWPVGIGHPCFGCVEKGVGFTKPLHTLADVKTHTPPNMFPEIADREASSGPSSGSTAVIAGAVGTIIGAGAVAAGKLGGKDSSQAGDQDN